MLQPAAVDLHHLLPPPMPLLLLTTVITNHQPLLMPVTYCTHH
jgi:hypothetical protein